MITVLMSVYNARPSELRRAVESILAQSWTDFEFLILDDGSTDPATHQELTCNQRWESGQSVLPRQPLTHCPQEDEIAGSRHISDPRIRLYFEPHRGLTRTLNRGLELARGEWIARQDADDWSDPDRLRRQMEMIAAHRLRPEAVGTGASGIVACGTNAWMHRQDGKPLWPTRLPEDAISVRRAFWEGNPMVHGSVLFRADVARQIGGYREAFPCSQDYDFFWRLSEWGPVVNLGEALYHYCFTAASVSSRRAREQAQVHWAAQFLAQRRHGREKEDVEEALRLAGQQLQAPSRISGQKKPTLLTADGWLRAALKQADHRLLAGDFRGALGEYLRLLRGHPASLLSWAKVARWALFTTCPPMRRACF